MRSTDTLESKTSFRRVSVPHAARLFEKLPRILRRHRLMRYWMCLTGEDPIQLVRIRNDFWAYADMRDGFLRLIVIDGDFESDFFRIADKLLEAGGHFFDVGANHGLLSFGLAERCRNVEFHLFEPNPKLVSTIKRSAARFPSMRLLVNAVALSDKEGHIWMSFSDDHSGASHFSPNEGVPVRCISLDQYLNGKKMEVALLKLDVEGYELVALRGAEHALAQHSTRAIYFEYSEKQLRRVQPPEELLEYLRSFGYEIYFCRDYDLQKYGGGTHHSIHGSDRRGIPLRPVSEQLPVMTDLIALPPEDVVSNKA